MPTYRVPFIVRGRIIDDCVLEFGGRKDGNFVCPDINQHLKAVLNCPLDSLMAYQETPVEEIARFLDEVGKAMSFDTNQAVQEAFELSSLTSGMTASILKHMYRTAPAHFFARDNVLEHAEKTIGINQLEGWVETMMADGTISAVRAYGARGVHVIAGNTPAVAITTILRGALTRSDCIIKLPSNDPLTAGCVLKTMVDIDPEHPVTRHLSSVYWKGGDEAVETKIYHPSNIEKIVAWGGFDSIKHITKYLRPGLDLITLDPKHSASIIGAEALGSDEVLHDVAKRVAADIGAFNQEACVSARTIYVLCDYEEAAQLEKLNRLGEYAFRALQELPDTLSTPAKYIESGLKEELDGLFFMEDYYRLYRDDDYRGAVIVSQTEEPVGFADALACRTANIVPIKSLDAVLARINAETQTIGVYPASLKRDIRGALAVRGAQMVVSLGYVSRMNPIGPLDAMETERRMLKWVVDQTQDESLPAPWVAP